MSLAEICERAYGKEQPLKIASIIGYEAGDLVRDMIRIEDYPDMAKVYTKMAQVSLGDVLAMAELFCGMMCWDFEIIRKDGVDRALERCEEKLDGKSGF